MELRNKKILTKYDLLCFLHGNLNVEGKKLDLSLLAQKLVDGSLEGNYCGVKIAIDYHNTESMKLYVEEGHEEVVRDLLPYLSEVMGSPIATYTLLEGTTDKKQIIEWNIVNPEKRWLEIQEDKDHGFLDPKPWGETGLEIYLAKPLTINRSSFYEFIQSSISSITGRPFTVKTCKPSEGFYSNISEECVFSHGDDEYGIKLLITPQVVTTYSYKHSSGQRDSFSEGRSSSPMDKNQAFIDDPDNISIHSAIIIIRELATHFPFLHPFLSVLQSSKEIVNKELILTDKLLEQLATYQTYCSAKDIVLHSSYFKKSAPIDSDKALHYFKPFYKRNGKEEQLF